MLGLVSRGERKIGEDWETCFHAVDSILYADLPSFLAWKWSRRNAEHRLSTQQCINRESKAVEGAIGSLLVVVGRLCYCTSEMGQA